MTDQIKCAGCNDLVPANEMTAAGLCVTCVELRQGLQAWDQRLAAVAAVQAAGEIRP